MNNNNESESASQTKADDWQAIDTPSLPPALPPDEIARLREKHYNATIIDRTDTHDALARFRIRPDDGFKPFQPGQYVTLGLGNWEPRLRDAQAEPLPESKWTKLVRRAYSISCPMVNLDGSHDRSNNEPLLDVNSVDYLEFYIALVRQADHPDKKPPGLTPRLFPLGAGDRIELGRKIVGHYVLGDLDASDTVLLVGTGTGEAPHNAIVTSLLANGHRGKVVNVTSVRCKSDLSYQREHTVLMNRFANYCYQPLTTRDPENLDTSHPGYVGKQYVQQFFKSGQMAERAGVELSPETTHVFLCGNPAMIGYTPPGAPPLEQDGMLQVLQAAGFTDQDDHTGPGKIQFEKYW